MLIPRYEIGVAHPVFAPAKINLRLNIIGRQENGYHELSMLNSQITFGDELEITINELPGVEITTCGKEAEREPETLNSPISNIAAKAAAAFLEYYAIDFGVSIKIDKKIPMGAGLGGGSADAGAVLRFLHEAFFSSLSATAMAENERELLKLGLTIGADVPYCIMGGAAIVAGIGEQVTPCALDNSEGLECLVFVPRFRIETKKIFNLYRIKHPKIEPKATGNSAQTVLALRENMWRGLLRNDLEDVVFDYAPQLKEYLSQLRQVPQVAALVSGSGSAFYAIPLAGLSFSDTQNQRFIDLFSGFDGQVFRTKLITETT